MAASAASKTKAVKQIAKNVAPKQNPASKKKATKEVSKAVGTKRPSVKSSAAKSRK